MKWFLAVLKKYADFKGRARRKEYWMFYLFYIIFLTAAMIIDNVLGITFKFLDNVPGVFIHYGYIYTLFGLATFMPGLAVAVRRLHDVGKSGWYYFIVLIPIGGIIWLLVLLCTEGDLGPNIYGPNPKAEPYDPDQLTAAV